MASQVEFTKYYDDFLQYFSKVRKVQKDCNLGGKPYVGSCGDDLIEQITIYDTVERRHAGFSNMLQDLWLADKAPKYYKWTATHQKRNKSFIGLHTKWGLNEWLYMFLFHRITGSGASFEMDHGYRNTAVPELAKCDTINQMIEVIKHLNRPFFTSIGNQIPPFPKPGLGYDKGGKLYLCEYAPKLVASTVDFIRDINSNKRKVLIREVVDFMCKWNWDRGIKRFHFQYTATVADLADYFPELVDESSHMYYGKNAKEAMSLFGIKVGKISKDGFYDIVMETAQKDTGGHPKDLEDIMCDYIRYVENYIPDNREKTYSHLDRTTVWNSSLIADHHRGRQKWMINTDYWVW